MKTPAPTYGYDCDCGCGYQLTPEQASKGCPQGYPEPCGRPLTPRIPIMELPPPRLGKPWHEDVNP